MRTLEELETRLAEPSEGLVEDLAALSGDIIVIGAGGKLGPSLVRLAANASRASGASRRIVAVSRFGSPGAEERLQGPGIRTVAADVTDERALAELPDAENVVYLVGEKFGSTQSAASTWATNAYLPGRIAERFAGARISALSTGTVYPMVAAESGGCTEEAAVAPVGDYAMSCVGRERILTHFAARTGSPLALIRLNYAVEMRYGILIDLATMILEGTPIDLSMPAANVVWQGYANEVTLRSLLHAAPASPFVINVTGPETVSIRYAASRLAERLGRDVNFRGEESQVAFLSNAAKCFGLFGYPSVTLDALIDATADWIAAGGATHGKPTKFQTSDGRF
ncbi:NAD-dependent epimerase/dehydratase family protein [Microbacterium tenebrionis]|uniref:NAD-dependent epimerase/dehydratase family protein n=1 Tax=Microbacterium tenebrionis TaxID=2830665 RepID=UPI00158901CC|nr:NAD-dependent epimerase/dehydratase family protein [Microbacterium ihumii]